MAQRNNCLITAVLLLFTGVAFGKFCSQDTMDACMDHRDKDDCFAMDIVIPCMKNVTKNCKGNDVLIRDYTEIIVLFETESASCPGIFEYTCSQSKKRQCMDPVPLDQLDPSKFDHQTCKLYGGSVSKQVKCFEGLRDGCQREGIKIGINNNIKALKDIKRKCGF